LKASRVLVTVSGPDTPGITARLTGLIADGNGRLIDIEQVVLSGQLTLCLVVDVDRGPGTTVVKELLFASKELGLELDFKVLDDVIAPASDTDAYAITVLGREVDARCVHALTSALADAGANVEEISRLSEADMSSLEIVIAVPRGASVSALRATLLAVARDNDVDLALQRDGISRRQKRLACFDMDSTLISIEVIDELARAHGVYEKVAAMTAEAMAGGLVYEESLRRRVALLKGMPLADVQRITADRRRRRPGARAQTNGIKNCRSVWRILDCRRGAEAHIGPRLCVFQCSRSA
jgi:phosphoserine phosphatase